MIVNFFKSVIMEEEQDRSSASGSEGRPRAEVTVRQCTTVDLQCLPKGHYVES